MPIRCSWNILWNLMPSVVDSAPSQPSLFVSDTKVPGARHVRHNWSWNRLVEDVVLYFRQARVIWDVKVIRRLALEALHAVPRHI